MVCVKKHFPITVNVVKRNEADCVEVKNFLGGKENLVIPVLPGVTVTKNTKNAEGELWFEGADRETVGKNCSLLCQACDVGEKDKRKFLDGIYVIEKGLIKE